MSSPISDTPHLDVIQAVIGTFWHFDLAREMERQGHLKCIYSTFPWTRIQREGVLRERVRTFPWIHTPQLVLGQRGLIPDALNREITWLMFRTFDAWVARNLPRCDVFVAISGAGLRAGQTAQHRGAKYICDRGSSHIRFQDRILREEFAIWGIEPDSIVDPRMIAREEAEYDLADGITVPSEFSRRSFIELGVPAHTIHRIPYGVRLDRFQRTTPPPSDRFEVLFAGGVNLRKGIPWLLQAFAQLRHPHKRLRLAGAVSPEIRPVLARLPQDHVEFLGALPQSQLAAAMSSSHVLVLPSVEDGFGLVMGQGMACGCPCISSRNTGGEDLFTDGVEGFLVPIRSAEAIAEKLQQLADDPALQQRMSEAALRRVRQIGGWKEYGDAWAILLREIRQTEAPKGAESGMVEVPLQRGSQTSKPS